MLFGAILAAKTLLSSILDDKIASSCTTSNQNSKIEKEADDKMMMMNDKIAMYRGC